MKKSLRYLFVFLFYYLKLSSQNLISNPSFSEVNERKNGLLQYQLLPGKLSDVKDWYLPTYINYKKHHLVSQFTSLYGYTYYYTSRDKDIFIKNRHYSNSDQLMENNLGHIFLHIDNLYPKTVIQQKISKPLIKGKYCFKFKYKHVKLNLKGDTKLEFSFSSTDLKEYYKQKLKVPISLINIAFKDTLNVGDKNIPWQQECFLIDLKGNEKYLTIGGLSNSKNFGVCEYYIDDIELYMLSDKIDCTCERVNKDLKKLYSEEFPLDKIISSDTLVMFKPQNSVIPRIISPDTKEYLRNIIAFMQRNPDFKIKFIEFSHDTNPTVIPIYYQDFEAYLIFFGIDQNRISAELKFCYDPTGIYCGPKSELIKIGFMLYK